METRAVSSTSGLVVTSIAAPTSAMRALANGARAAGTSCYCIGDAKTPSDWRLPGFRFFSLEEQRHGGLALGRALPVGHYARKNLGYLIAIAEGAECIVETDDDNHPLPRFWRDAPRWVSGRQVSRDGWVNAYAFFTASEVWPRGLPLEAIAAAGIAGARTTMVDSTDCPVQQGLANGDTDVDAVYRMTRGHLVEFEDRAPLMLAPGAWCPFNSQNTRWWRPAFEMLYLPSYCSFRMTDIWRSFVVQACLWANGWRLVFLPASVHQERNPHNLLRDFEAEIPGYLNNQRIVEALSGLDLGSGENAIRDNLRWCYGALVGMDVVGAAELDLLELWFDDLDLCLAGGGL